MKRILITVALAFGLTTFATGVAAAAQINNGRCHKQLNADATAQTTNANQAPGQVGNGPLTVTNGNFNTPGGFNGWVGCSKS